MLQKLTRMFKKSTKWSKVLICLGLLLLGLVILNKNSPRREGFRQRKKYILKTNEDIFDEFYVPVYNQLMDNKIKNIFEVKEIARTTKFDPHSVLLDIGSGLGHHVHLFNKIGGDKCIGLDKSEAMVNAAKYKYNNLDFKRGNVMDFMNFEKESFTHITCLYFTVYYIKDKTRFFKNCYDWLMPSGYLALHLVNRDKFDPILEAANPLHIVSPQKYAKKRITNSIVKFNNFDYKSNFKLDKNNIAFFDEYFKDRNSKKVRHNQHQLYMETQKHILSLARQAGFILKGKIDMIGCQYEYQYIYILSKPS
jgi:SAM-dependent methyltransferase